MDFNLSDPVLRTEFEAFYKTGAITEAEMAEALVDLAKEEGSTGVVSSAQMADLQSIATNIGSLGASPYLEDITDNLVYGNTANQFFTGGAASSTPLGNLAAGSSELVLAKLTDKWFLGTDLPSDDVTVGGTTTQITYLGSDAPLWSSGGPQMSDVNQGVDSGDCYFLAALADVAQNNPAAIESMITVNSNSTYGVRFYNLHGGVEYVTVDTLLPSGGGVFNTYNVGDWVNILQVAFAEAQEQGLLTGNPAFDVWNSFTTIDNSGFGYGALEAITGASAFQEFVVDPNASSWDEIKTKLTGWGPVSSTTNVSEASALSTIVADLLIGDDIELGSTTKASNAGLETLIPHHAYSVYGFDAATNELELRDPLGVQAAPFWATTFEVSLNTLLSDNDGMYADNMGKATTVNGAPVVAASALQAMTQVASFSVTDFAGDIDAGLGALETDSKLSSVTVSASTGGVGVSLSGYQGQATIDLGGGNGAATLVYFTSIPPGLILGSNADTIALGSGPSTIAFAFGAGVDGEVSGFNAARDELSISMPQGASVEQTLVLSGDWVTSATDFSHGILLEGITTLQSVTLAHGVATVA